MNYVHHCYDNEIEMYESFSLLAYTKEAYPSETSEQLTSPSLNDFVTMDS